MTYKRCDSWLDLNGGRMHCSLPAKHKSPHECLFKGPDTSDQIIQGTLTWTCEARLLKVVEAP